MGAGRSSSSWVLLIAAAAAALVAAAGADRGASDEAQSSSLVDWSDRDTANSELGGNKRSRFFALRGRRSAPSYDLDEDDAADVVEDALFGARGRRDSFNHLMRGKKDSFNHLMRGRRADASFSHLMRGKKAAQEFNHFMRGRRGGSDDFHRILRAGGSSSFNHLLRGKKSLPEEYEYDGY